VNEEPKTLREIGEELGISSQAVAEIIERAMRKIRQEFFRRKIEKEDLLDD
jgi:DNA-directed RNA polymerase sigma subunit (sigma70/sigma32)